MVDASLPAKVEELGNAPHWRCGSGWPRAVACWQQILGPLGEIDPRDWDSLASNTYGIDSCQHASTAASIASFLSIGHIPGCQDLKDPVVLSSPTRGSEKRSRIESLSRNL
jgi:hypothetical protein